MIAKRRWAGLSAKLLLLTVAFVMIAEVLIYAPSAGRFRHTFLIDRISDAHLATLAVNAAPFGRIEPELEQRLLRHAGVHSVETRLAYLWQRMLGPEGEHPYDLEVDLRKQSFSSLLWGAIETLAHPENRVLKVIGRSALNNSVTVEIIMDEAPMRAAMLDYSSPLHKSGIPGVISV